jgi:opacity protein-like surface antigen
MRKVLGVVALTMALLPSPAFAQEEGKIGVTMGFPTGLGVLWHVTENIAIRPELTFSWSSSDSDFGDSDGFGIGTGLSALFYLNRSDNLATYVTPRYSFTRATTERRFEPDVPVIDPETETTSRSHTFSGSFGAQYFLGSRFSIFGEAGLSYMRTSSDSDFGSDPTSSTFGTRSQVGVVLYF